MSDERTIKIHCNERMRAHIEFVLRRYAEDAKHELSVGNERLRRTRPHAARALEADIELTIVCLKEANEAGT